MNATVSKKPLLRYLNISHQVGEEMHSGRELASKISRMDRYTIILRDRNGNETIGCVHSCDDKTLVYMREGQPWNRLFWVINHLADGSTLTTGGMEPQFYRVFTAIPVFTRNATVSESPELIEQLRDQEARMYLSTHCPACEQQMLVTIPDSPVRCGGCGRSWALSFKLKLEAGL